MEEAHWVFKSSDYIVQETVNWLEGRLLDGEMRIREIPRILRVTNSGLYVTAFRFGRHTTCNRYVQDLQLLISDIMYVGLNSHEGEWLLHDLSSALHFHPFGEEEEYIEFVRTIPEEYFAEMERDGAIVREAIGRVRKKQHKLKQ